MESRLIFK